MKDTSPLRLILVNDSLEDAETQCSLLRNAGMAVRPERPESEDSFQENLHAQHRPDLVLFRHENKILPYEDVRRLVDESGFDLPVLVIADKADSVLRLKYMQQAAADWVPMDAAELLPMVVLRERNALENRRELRRMEGAVKESEKRSHALLDSSRDAIAYVHEGVHVFANRAYLDMYDFQDFDEIEALPIMDMIARDDHEEFKKLLRRLSKGETPPEEVRMHGAKASGDTFEIVLSFSPASIEGEACTQIVFRRPDSENLDGLRDQDLLTGLNNRQAYMTALDKALVQSQQIDADIFHLAIELDNYRAVSDDVGISGTDLILGDMADVLRGLADEKDSLARFGDHVFTFLSHGRPKKEVQALGKKIMEVVASHIFEVGKKSVSLTVSIGVAPVTEAAGSTEVVVQNAATALSEAINAGGGKAVFYKPQSSADNELEREWVVRTKKAIKDGRFALVYQTVISLHGGDGEYSQVLVRMIEDGKEYPAADFLPIAEKHGLMPHIDHWIIREAIRVTAEKSTSGDVSTLFLKISPETYADPKLLPWLAKELKAARITGESIVFCVPESKVVVGLKDARQFCRGLKQLHCKMALEQFGTGVNSFQVLKHVPADYLKIDRSLMKDLTTNTESQQKVKSIADEAHAAGKLTIAEFVEDAASMSLLWQFGVNFVEGEFLQDDEKVLSNE